MENGAFHLSAPSESTNQTAIRILNQGFPLGLQTLEEAILSRYYSAERYIIP
jgi:hypothetical protein